MSLQDSPQQTNTQNNGINDQTKYQILVVSPDTAISEKHIKTKIVTRSRAEFATQEYVLDKVTRQNLQNYPPIYNEEDKRYTIGAYLPSCGAVFTEKFKKNFLYPQESNQAPDFSINNFYQPIQNLLQTRKISQLIARTWYAYLEAEETITPWKNFINGHWKDVNESHDNPNLKTNILDGLISREIFFFDKSYSPDELDPGLETYKDFWHKPNINKYFVIPPTSYAWQGIVLSLLLAGQAYYEVEEEGQKRYHQICQPILSTGDIVFRYAIEVEWDQFKGRIQEMELQPGKSSVASKATVPYPPIPRQEGLTRGQIQAWAEAEDEGEGVKYPFYPSGEDSPLDVKYFAPPFPYLPLSTC